MVSPRRREGPRPSPPAGCGSGRFSARSGNALPPLYQIPGAVSIATRGRRRRKLPTASDASPSGRIPCRNRASGVFPCRGQTLRPTSPEAHKPPEARPMGRNGSAGSASIVPQRAAMTPPAGSGPPARAVKWSEGALQPGAARERRIREPGRRSPEASRRNASEDLFQGSPFERTGPGGGACLSTAAARAAAKRTGPSLRTGGGTRHSPRPATAPEHTGRSRL